MSFVQSKYSVNILTKHILGFVVIVICCATKIIVNNNLTLTVCADDEKDREGQKRKKAGQVLWCTMGSKGG